MKHIIFSDRILTVGDVAADCLAEFAAVLARRGSADTVHLRAYGIDEREVVATLLLGPAITMMIETCVSTLLEPDNSRAIDYMSDRIGALETVSKAFPLEPSLIISVEELDI